MGSGGIFVEHICLPSSLSQLRKERVLNSHTEDKMFFFLTFASIGQKEKNVKNIFAVISDFFYTYLKNIFAVIFFTILIDIFKKIISLAPLVSKIKINYIVKSEHYQIWQPTARKKIDSSVMYQKMHDRMARN